jgi:benzoyl-CoA reductase/2-hydroxyglutaryl-CoA dehydratase subunit BcrC/BadD/HgdB
MPGARASRLVGLEDMLHMPPCNTVQCVKEAKKKQIRGVAHLVSASCTQAVQGSYSIRKNIEDAGVSLLELRAGTIDARDWDDPRMTAEIEAFLETRLGVKP